MHQLRLFEMLVKHRALACRRGRSSQPFPIPRCLPLRQIVDRAVEGEAKNKQSALIDGLRAGSPVLIVDRGRPVARLEAVTGDQEGHQDDRLSRLVRDGLVRPRRSKPSETLFSVQPPRAKAGASALDALIEERQEGR